MLRASRELVIPGDPYQHTAKPTSMEDVFIRLLIGDRTETEWPAPDSVRGLYDRFMLTVRLSEKLIQRVEEQGENGPADDDYIEGTLAGRRYAHLISRAWWGRRVAVTRKGYVCLIPEHVRQGDAVWLVDGAQTPYVLRPRGATGTWEFVGDCYVHGVMDGSAVVSDGPREVIKLV